LDGISKKPNLARFIRAREYMAYSIKPLIICYSNENLLQSTVLEAQTSTRKYIILYDGAHTYTIFIGEMLFGEAGRTRKSRRGSRPSGSQSSLSWSICHCALLMEMKKWWNIYSDDLLTVNLCSYLLFYFCCQPRGI
jgi:hypothetical protein